MVTCQIDTCIICLQSNEHICIEQNVMYCSIGVEVLNNYICIEWMYLY